MQNSSCKTHGFCITLCFLYLLLLADCLLPSDQEHAVLLRLKDYWKLPSTWDSSTSHCYWQGISCSDLNYSAVTAVSLSYRNLNAPIPPFICELRNLEFLELINNNIPGEFPRGLYNCSKLTYLDISHNLLVGRIPSDIDRMSANLEHLKLGANNFAFDIPSSVGRLRNLKELSFFQSQYNGSYPPEIGNLAKLETLDMSHNTRLMPSKLLMKFNGLRNLKTLRISDSNLIGEIPEAIGDLGLLETLDLSMNGLTGKIPSSIFKLKFLVELDLKNNQLSGMIPAEIGSLVNLTRIDLSQNQLSGAVPGLEMLDDLHFISLSSNCLTGIIPSRFASYAYWYSFRNNSGLCCNDTQLSVDLGITACDHSQPRNFLPQIVALIVGGVVSVALIILVFFIKKKILVLILRVYRRRKKDRVVETGSMATIWKFTQFHILSFTESDILSGLTECNLVGSGGSGKVYRVPVDQSGTFVAVKRIWVNTKLGHNREKEFQAEVEILGKIRHLNIVKLLCCLSSESSKLLVYKYLENRSLDQWLDKKKRVSNDFLLDWPKRLKIAIGAAQGLCYMHHDCSPPIIHRDVKSSNILLDSEFNAQVADFGIAKLLMKPGQTNTASVVAGTFGYIAPEYAQTRRLSEKSDVYSFGVVLLELTTGRAANDRNEEYCLADWAWHYIQDEKPISEALDEEIVESCNLEEMSSMLKLGIMCIRRQPSARPTMKQVLQMLLRCKTEP